MSIHTGSRDRLSQAAIRAADPERDASMSVTPAPGLIALHKGDPCFDTPPEILAAADEAARRGFTHYPPVLGDPDLRAALAAELDAISARPATAEGVVITVGAIGALAVTLLAYLDPGDEALLLDPTYSGYAPLIRQAGATPVYVPLVPGSFALDLDALEHAVTPATKLLVLSNPSNPTGVVLSRDELESLAKFLTTRDLLLVADEVYDRLVFTGSTFTSVLTLPDLAERTLYVNSFSKTYAMTGFRVGYVFGPPHLLRGPATLQRNTVNGVNWPAQRAALAAVRAGRQAMEHIVAGYAERRAALIAALRRRGNVEFPAPDGAFYVFARFARAVCGSEELRRVLLRAGVAVRAGSEFGPCGEGYLRLSYSAEMVDIERGVERILTVLDERFPD